MTYEYVCEACGHQWEAEQSIKDSPLKTCVSCGENRAKRLVSGGTGFLLKGGGWYADLYGSPGSGAAKSDDKAGKAASSTKSESSESKPAAADAKPAADTSKPAASSASTPAAAPAASSSTTSAKAS